MTLTHEEQKIMSALPHGEANAIPYRTLAFRVQIEPRRFRRLVKHLIEVHLAPVASNSSSGYFIPACMEEAKHTVNELRSRGAESFIRSRKFGKACELYFKRDIDRDIKQLSLGGM